MDLPEPELADDADGLPAPHHDVDVLGRPHHAAGEEQAHAAVGLGQPLGRQRHGPGLGLARRWLQARDGGDKHARVVGLGPAQDVAAGALLHHAARLHDDDAVGDLGHHAEVVGDEQHAGAAPLLQLPDQLQDLRLRGHVERRGGLVGDQQGRVEHQGRGDHDALALTAGDLVGIDVDQALGLGQVHGAHDLQHALAAVGLGELGVDLQHLGDLVAHRHDRVECGHRLLEDHGHARAAQAAQARGLGLQHILALEQDLAGGGPQLARQQPHHGLGGDGLAGARFAHHAHDLAGVDGEGDVLDGVGTVGARRQSHGEAFDSEDRRGSFGHPRLSHPLGEARVERVAQAVAQHVDGQHRQRQAHARIEDVVGIDAEQRAPLGHDVAPGRRLRRYADP